MSSTIPTIPAGAHTPAKVYPKPTEPADATNLPQESAAVPRPLEHHHSAAVSTDTSLTPDALSSTEVSYVKALMGALPAQKMQQILLRTGIPMPANLGPNVDTSA